MRRHLAVTVPQVLACAALASTCALRASTSSAAPAAPAAAGTVPGIVPGWPVLLRGGITGAPVAADVDGDGAPEIVAPAMHRGGEWAGAGRTPRVEPVREPQLWAVRLTGEVVPAWPVTLPLVEARDPNARPEPGLTGNWYSSPTVCDVNGDGADEVLIGLPHTKQRRIMAAYGDGTVIPIHNGGEPWASIPVADIDSDGTLDLVAHDAVATIGGKPLPDWPHARRPQMVYQPAIGDMDGDGEVEVFVGTFEKDWQLPNAPDARRLEGWDRKGNRLPGWPQKMTAISAFVSLGDVWGDKKKEVVAVNLRGDLHVWNHDGTPAAPGSGADATDASIVRRIVGAGYAPPCLADIDGDGQAEIILLERSRSTISVLRGNGKPFATPPPAAAISEPTPEQIEAAIKTLHTMRRIDPQTKKERVLDPANPEDRKFLERVARLRLARRPPPTGEGVLATLPGGETGTFAGVVAADLGGDGVLDLFAGTSWIQVAKDGTATVLPMLSEAERGGGRNATSCSIVEVEGMAHIAFGLSDGRLFLFRTGLSLKKEHAQWISPGGNFQHTSVWESRR
jgi:hypothetical protein